MWYICTFISELRSIGPCIVIDIVGLWKLDIHLTGRLYLMILWLPRQNWPTLDVSPLCFSADDTSVRIITNKHITLKVFYPHGESFVSRRKCMSMSILLERPTLLLFVHCAHSFFSLDLLAGYTVSGCDEITVLRSLLRLSPSGLNPALPLG